MKRSRRYQETKEKISDNKYYNVSEAIDFLRNNNSEKSKNIKVSFSLNHSKWKTVAPLKSKIILPYPIPSKGKIAVVKDDLSAKMTNNLTKIKEVELLSVEEAHQRIIAENTNKIKKKTQWGFKKLVLPPQSEKKFKLPEKLLPKLFGLIARKVLLTESILEAVGNFQHGEQEIKADKGGNIHAVIGKSDYSLEQLEQNYQTVYNRIKELRPIGLKGDLLKNITLSTTMGPGLKILK